jgi:two-component system LytT family sensor kinase
MKGFSNSKISFSQALQLAMIALIVYFPIIIYVNVSPSDILRAISFFVVPAVISYMFYILFILAADRIIQYTDELIGDKFQAESQIPAIIISIPVAILATWLSRIFFGLSLDLVQDVASQFDFHYRAPVAIDKVRMESIQRLNTGLTFIIVLSIYYLIINRNAGIKMKELELRSQRLITQNTIARFEALKNQVSPDFLFNCLSVLSSLVRVNVDLSEEFIGKFSGVYQYILEQKDNDLVPLTAELDFIKSYAFLAETRFGDKFRLVTDASQDEAIRYSIPPLTLQLLIENAIKHNRMSREEPLVIKISISDNYLAFENTIQMKDQKLDNTVSTGVGLQNIKSRYDLLTTAAVHVSHEGGKFKVEIPLIS